MVSRMRTVQNIMIFWVVSYQQGKNHCLHKEVGFHYAITMKIIIFLMVMRMYDNVLIRHENNVTIKNLLVLFFWFL